MDVSAALQTVSKAIAGALVSAVVALAARYGLNLDQATQDALGLLLTAFFAGAAGFIAVYIAPKNKTVKK